MNEIPDPKAQSPNLSGPRVDPGTARRSDPGVLAGLGFSPSNLSAGWFAILLGGFVFVAFPQVLLGWETFFLRDFGLFVYPLAYYQRECFWHGELPFWNPYSNCGVPFLAQWNTMPLYPAALIYLLFPLQWSLGFFDLLHLWFGGVGMYMLAKRWASNRFGASIAGLVFAFNGLSLNLLMWPSHMATVSWMPWVILAAERAWREGGRKIVVAAGAGAMQMLAGGPETILLTWVLVLALWASECAFGAEMPNPKVQNRGIGPGAETGSAPSRTGQTGLRLVVVIALVAGLAAVQLLPFFDLAAHSQRQRDYEAHRAGD